MPISAAVNIVVDIVLMASQLIAPLSIKQSNIPIIIELILQRGYTY
jgi:hypothetical protein